MRSGLLLSWQRGQRGCAHKRVVWSGRDYFTVAPRRKTQFSRAGSRREIHSPVRG